MRYPARKRWETLARHVGHFSFPRARPPCINTPPQQNPIFPSPHMRRVIVTGGAAPGAHDGKSPQCAQTSLVQGRSPKPRAVGVPLHGCPLPTAPGTFSETLTVKTPVAPTRLATAPVPQNSGPWGWALAPKFFPPFSDHKRYSIIIQKSVVLLLASLYRQVHFTGDTHYPCLLSLLPRRKANRGLAGAINKSHGLHEKKRGPLLFWFPPPPASSCIVPPRTGKKQKKKK